MDWKLGNVDFVAASEDEPSMGEYDTDSSNCPKDVQLRDFVFLN